MIRPWLARRVEAFRFLVQHDGFSKSPCRRITRAAAWLLLLALGRQPKVRIPRWDLTYRLPEKRRGPAKVFYVFEDYYEPEVRVLERLIRRGMTVLDVGANFGLYTLMASRLVGETGRVFAFEPFHESAHDLKENIRLNGCGNVTLYECALSDRNGTADLYIHEDPGRNTLGDLKVAGGKKISIPLKTIDALAGEEKLAGLDLIKMDVEGAEELVLRGGEEALKRFQPLIVFEITSTGPARLGLKREGAWDFLAQLGYHFYDFEDERLVPIETPRSANTLAVPKDYAFDLPLK